MIGFPRLISCIATLIAVLLLLVDVRPLAVAADGGPILMVTSQETGPYKDVLTGFRQYFANRMALSVSLRSTLSKETTIKPARYSKMPKHGTHS